MIQARGKTDSGRPFIILGLEEGNVTCLRDGQPIHLHADALGFFGEIIIILGKDCDSLKRDLADLIDPRTEVIDRRSEKKQ